MHQASRSIATGIASPAPPAHNPENTPGHPSVDRRKRRGKTNGILAPPRPSPASADSRGTLPTPAAAARRGPAIRGLARQVRRGYGLVSRVSSCQGLRTARWTVARRRQWFGPGAGVNWHPHWRFRCAIRPVGDTFPIGLMLHGRPWEEALRYCVAHTSEQTTEWYKRHPVLSRCSDCPITTPYPVRLKHGKAPHHSSLSVDREEKMRYIYTVLVMILTRSYAISGNKAFEFPLRAGTQTSLPIL
jgi:hypothetical protein